MADIVHRIAVRSPQTSVYRALTTRDGLAGWWTEEVEEDCEQKTLTFRFRTPAGELKGEAQMQMEPTANGSEVHWRCIAGPDEWLGTDITFALSEEEGKTLVRFGHRNWREQTDFTSHCSMKWATFLLSLREFVETGTGRPSPRDLKIDNWN